MTEPGRGGKGWLMAGLGVGAALVIGGGAYAAVQFLGSDEAQPESVLPASAAVYLRVDVDPSVGQKVAAVRFFQGLDPELQAALESGEWREYVWDTLEKDGKAPAGLDYATDVEPWLGDRAGVAVVPDGDEKPLVAIALQVKDGDKALASLDKITASQADQPEDEQVEYYLDGDYVILTQVGQADKVKAAAEQGTLDEQDAFTDDMDELGDPGVASFWVDMAKAAEIDTGALEEAAAAAGGAPSAVTSELTDEQKALLSGRTAGALRLSADAVEIHGLSRGNDAMTMPTGESAHLVLDLPADTKAAFSLENGADWVQAAWDLYDSIDPQITQELSAQASEQGFTLPDDLKTVLGDSMALAVGPGMVEAVDAMSGTEAIALPELPVAYRVQTDTTAVNTLLEGFGLPPTMLAQRTDEGVLTVGLYQAFVDGLVETEGRLADQEAFTATVADADEADQLLFVDVSEYEDLYLPEVTDEKARAALEKLRAVGWSTVVTGADESRFTMRFVADEE
ncbi:DUF3352 domain-containing protein [Ornithinimicrobium tianjinense]|uniref:DUF3352 domain-containing protein n=1 Tax=Ornithinimicrobium tianjinense TaxID=1195761 RepID=A0A917F2V3_9MICO|nr:DUF3352 domain-containing protein [Ornithinimicrobium tianjinense]GGF37622.1 hypothetical protein GCM10011366_01410 [Ornithinimicrobium tianjinense]